TMGADATHGFAARAGLLLSDAARWDEALAVLARQPDRTLFVETLGRALRGVPPLEAERANRWFERITEEEAAGDPELAVVAAALRDDAGDPQSGIRILD